MADEPVWRSLLGASIKYGAEENWHLSILHAAFALEAVIDMLLHQHVPKGMPEKYIEHFLRVGEKKYELQAPNEIVLKTRFSKTQVDKLFHLS